ncbi:pyridoxal-phosphate-dependent aminotransferase family protein [Anaerosolibacter sp.]|uniref:pyridoxal-phosphate-dependent aminotransferase family protein n=1 Tax=Anaerosolibacter sp. TaxID=1872527 RepID=UPI0039EFE8FC
MKRPLIMTPGPTSIHEEVRRSLSEQITNPDLDMHFFDFYKETCSKLQRVLKTDNDVLILNGEGILGLEAACASLIEPGDRVLCIDNGIFGNGFGDFARMYGAEVVYFKSDYRKAVNVLALEKFLDNDNAFTVATLVHCETPSGITNSVEQICQLLNKFGIISVVDSVSGIGGEPIETDKWKMDIVLGGSQKCLSAPPGLTFLSISEKAWKKILNRRLPIAGYYVNLSIWKDWYQNREFPYTQPINDIFGFHTAIERWLSDENPLLRHKVIGEAARKSLIEAGLELFPLEGFSNTVTTINIPENTKFKDVFNSMLEDHNILIAGAFGFLKDKVIRIGHMGENCYEDRLYVALKALDNVFRKNNVKLNVELHKAFISKL